MRMPVFCRPAILAIVVVSIWLPSFAARQAQVSSNTMQIELRPEVQVPRPQVTLGDIAAIAGPAGPELHRLASLPLGELTPGGEVVTIEQAALARWIRARLGLDPARLVWSGAAASHVHVATQAVSGERVAMLARTCLRSELHASGLRADVNLAQTPPDVNAPQGLLELKVRSPMAEPSLDCERPVETSPSGANKLLAKRQSVWVDIWVDGRFARAVPVSLEVSAYGPASVAAHDLKMGQTLNATPADTGELMVRDVEWSGRRSAPFLVASAPGSDQQPTSDATSLQAQTSHAAMRLRRPVAAGQTLTHADVEPMPWVVRGDIATLHVIQGAIDLESRVEVLQDGLSGQTVRVRRASENATLIARVTAPGQVEVRQ